MTKIEIVSIFLRLSGVIALGLLTVQIYLGANRKNIKLHMLNGILTYIVVLIHPIFYLLFRYYAIGKIDPLYVFVDVCVLCQGIHEHYLNLGRISFYLLTITVISVKFKNISNWLKENWRKLHILNYVAFYFVSIHSILIGTDSKNIFFIIYFLICQLIVLVSVYKKLKTINLKEITRKIKF